MLLIVGRTTRLENVTNVSGADLIPQVVELDGLRAKVMNREQRSSVGAHAYSVTEV